MRTLAVSICILATAAIQSYAGDGPRLLENRPIKPTALPSASIRVDVAMTLVPVAVTDTRGNNVLGLDRQNFRVFDGREQRPIVSFGQQDAPVSVGIVFDCSHSMADKMKIARDAPRQLFGHLNAEDEAFLVTVSSRSELRQDYTSHFSSIQNGLVFTAPRGQTSLLDGIYLALGHLKHAHNPRKALIVVSDGGDNNSRYTLRELQEVAQEADAQVFSICLFGNPQTVEEAEGPRLLEKLATASGGISYVISDPKEMTSVFGRIGATIHNEYVLGYYPPDDAPSGKYRKIKVQLVVPEGLPKLEIFARSGYYRP